MIRINLPKTATNCLKRFLSTQPTKEADYVNQHLPNAAKTTNSNKKIIGTGIICVVMGMAIGKASPVTAEKETPDSGDKMPSILSSIREVFCLRVQRFLQVASKDPIANGSSSQDPTTKTVVENPPLKAKEDSPSLITTVYNSPTAQAIGYGALGAGLACTGNPLVAAIPLGFMGSKLLDISGGYEYIKNQTFKAIGIVEDSKPKET